MTMTTCMMTYPPARCTLPVGHDGPHATRDGYGWHDSDDMGGGVAAALIEKEAEPDEGAHIGPGGEIDWRGMYLDENRRAEKAERYRDQYRQDAIKAEWEREESLRLAKTAADQADDALGMVARGECHDCILDAAVIREHRPLTPADITLHSANSASWVRVRVEHPALGVIEEGIPLPTASAPNVVTDEMVERAKRAYVTRRYKDGEIGRVTPELRNAIHDALTAALTPEPPRPEGAEEIETALSDVWTFGDDTERADLADRLAEAGVRVQP